MLDTNIVSDMMSYPDGRAQRRARFVSEGLAISVVAAGELRFGVERKRSLRLGARLEDLLRTIEVLPVKSDVSLDFARLRTDLERRGTPIGTNDLWIAAHALSLGVTLITDNVREFGRVEGLTIDNWLRD